MPTRRGFFALVAGAIAGARYTRGLATWMKPPAYTSWDPGTDETCLTIHFVRGFDSAGRLTSSRVDVLFGDQAQYNRLLSGQIERIEG